MQVVNVESLILRRRTALHLTLLKINLIRIIEVLLKFNIIFEIDWACWLDQGVLFIHDFDVLLQIIANYSII